MADKKDGKGSFSLTRKIDELFNLGDTGKLDSFFTRVTKDLKMDIAVHEKNIDTLRFNHEHNMVELKYDLEDSVEAVANTFTSVNMELIGDNSKQKSYSPIWLATVKAAMEERSDCEAAIEAAVEQYNAATEAIEADVEELKTILKEIK
jgi:hypothetical protein